MADFELLAPGGHQELVDEVLDRLDTKADYDGYYAQLTAGAADNLTGRGDGVSASYLYRTTGGDADVADGTATVKSIHGRTVVWNQLCRVTARTATSKGITYTADASGKVTLSAPSGATDTEAFYTDPANVVSIVEGHKYLVCGGSTVGVSLRVGSNLGGPVPKIISTATESVSGAILFRVNSTFTGTYECYPQLFDLTAMFGAGNEPSTVAEFEALYPLPYYEYDAGSLLSVQMEGIETVGFNQYDAESNPFELKNFEGATSPGSGNATNAGYIDVFPSTEYEFRHDAITGVGGQYVRFYDADKAELGETYRIVKYVNNSFTFTTPAGARYARFMLYKSAGITLAEIAASQVCLHLVWSGYRNGEYEPYWQSERTIPAATYFPNGMRSAGTVYDELTSEEAVTRVGAVDLGTLTWQVNDNWGGYRAFYTSALRSVIAPHTSYGVANIWCSALAVKSRNELYESSADGITQSAKDITCRYDGATTADEFKAAMSGVMLYYALATPTVAPIDPPLNLSYKVSDFGTERIMHTDPTAAPTQQVVYGLNVVDTVRRLPTEYISHDSFTQFRIALATFLGATITESWDATDGRYEYTITQNGE